MPAASQPQPDAIEEMRMVLAGYRACASEALRFLVEQEHMPLDNPLVLGLWNHLLDEEARLETDGALLHANLGSEADDSGLSMEHSAAFSSTADALLPTENAQESSEAVTVLDSRSANVAETDSTEVLSQTLSDVSTEEVVQPSILPQYNPPVTVHTSVEAVPTLPTTVCSSETPS